MEKFVSYEKLSKKAKKLIDAKKRTIWNVKPLTKMVESKKRYNRADKSWRAEFA